METIMFYLGWLSAMLADNIIWIILILVLLLGFWVARKIIKKIRGNK